MAYATPSGSRGGGIHRISSAEGAIEFSAPQVAGRDEPFRSAIRDHTKGRTEALEELAVEMLARGLSVRDIEDAFRADDGRLLLSRTAVSELGPSSSGATIRTSSRAISASTTSSISSSTAWPSASAPASGASR